MTRSSCHDTQRNNSRPYLTISLERPQKEGSPGGSIRICGASVIFFVYIAHFPRKSKLYGEIKRYFCHAGRLNLGQVVNATDTPVDGCTQFKKLRLINRHCPDWEKNISPCRPRLPRTWSRRGASSWS